MNKPKTVTMRVYVHKSEFHAQGLQLIMSDLSEHGMTCLGPVDVTFDVPDVDVVALEIATLEAAKSTLVTEYETKLAQLDEKLQNLRSLTYQEPV